MVQLADSLPAPRTSLIGRERDVAETRELVLHGRERLVTLTGVGGSGKTRLALQVAVDLRDAFPDGVWLVELSPISDPLLLFEAVAAALGVREASSDTLLNALVASLQARSILIVLDNCEHVIDACANLVDSLLSACPSLRILATSREPLQIAGERQRRVLPLSVPEPTQMASPDELEHYSSVKLFIERASSIEPDFSLTSENATAVAQICALLGGIPLAIELAAARVRVLSVGQIVQRLDDCFRLLAGNSRSAPTRQQTLKATLDWSYNLLSAQERVAFRRLAVFAGGWGLDGAEAVCSAGGLERADVLDVLTRLVDKSLVLVEEHGGEARYRLLEPVRQYAEKLLKESGEVETVRAQFREFCVALVERVEPEMHGPRQFQWLRRLDRELDSFRAVLSEAQERGDTETSLRLAGALHWYFWMRRHLREGHRWLETALARGDAVAPKVRAKGMFGLALMLAMLGEHAKGLEIGRDALDLYREVRDPDGMSMITTTMAMMTLSQGDLPEAKVLAEEGIRLAREVGSWWPLGHALVILGQAISQQGDKACGVEFHDQALAVFREHEDTWSLSYAMMNLAAIQQDRPDVTRAAALSTVRLYWEQEDYQALAAALEYLARQSDPGRIEEQVRLFAAAHSLRKSLGCPSPIGERADLEGHLETARSSLGEARFTSAWAEGYAMSLDQVVASALEECSSTASKPPSQLPTSSRQSPGPSDSLTRREMEVALLLARGYTDRQIAEELTIAEGTAGVHVHHILEKLGLRSRVQVADWALSKGLIDNRPE